MQRTGGREATGSTEGRGASRRIQQDTIGQVAERAVGSGSDHARLDVDFLTGTAEGVPAVTEHEHAGTNLGEAVRPGDHTGERQTGRKGGRRERRHAEGERVVEDKRRGILQPIAVTIRDGQRIRNRESGLDDLVRRVRENRPQADT